MNTAFSKLLDTHIGTVFARQLLFADFIKTKQEPSIDLEKGTVDFGNGIVCTIQLLGTQVDADNTWLWAWSEANSDLFHQSTFKAPFPEALLQDAKEIKAFGGSQEIDPLSHPKIVLELSSVPLVPDEFNGDHIACAAAGILNTAYWRDTRDEGVVYYLVKNPAPEIMGPYTVPHILNTIEQITSYFNTDDKVMVESFLTQQGYSIQWQDIMPSDQADHDEEEEEEGETEEGFRLTAHRGTEEITALFDLDGILTEIEAHGFEGEENYQETEENSNDLDADNLLGQWNDYADADDEFPPRMPPSNRQKLH